jgi:hypothetical protein
MVLSLFIYYPHTSKALDENRLVAIWRIKMAQEENTVPDNFKETSTTRGCGDTKPNRRDWLVSVFVYSFIYLFTWRS